MKKVVWGFLALLLSVIPASAQVSLTGYGGRTSGQQTDLMVMGDIGGKIVVEPWVERTGSDLSAGSDVLVFPSKFVGVVGGVDTGYGAHAGVAVNVLGAQVRVLKHTSGEWQGVGYYNFNLSPTWYLQVWAAPGTDTSKLFLGLGYNFKR